MSDTILAVDVSTRAVDGILWTILASLLLAGARLLVQWRHR